MGMEQSAARATVIVTYCYRSPFCALIVDALFRLPADYDVVLDWRLVEETPRPSSLPITIENPRFLYNRQDCARRARWLHLPWAPPDWRLRDVRAATAIGQLLLMRRSPLFERFTVVISRAYWCHQRDISDPRIAAEIAREVGLDPKMIEEALAGSSAVRTLLDENAARCLRDGVLGVPFFELDGERFWGSDRLSDLQTCLTELGYDRASGSGKPGNPPAGAAAEQTKR